jgi:hypothetical protein
MTWLWLINPHFQRRTVEYKSLQHSVGNLVVLIDFPVFDCVSELSSSMRCHLRYLTDHRPVL